MATVITTSTTTAGDNITIAAGEDIFVAAGVVRASQTGRGMSALSASHTIDIWGTVYGDTVGLDLGASTSADTFSTVTIGASASILGHDDGILSRGTNVKIANNGYIKGNQGLIHEGGDDFAFVNTGTVVGSFGSAVHVNSDGGEVVNHGTIVGQESGSAVVLVNSDNTGNAPFLYNYGKIIATAFGIDGDDNDSNWIRNFGEIHGSISGGSVIDIVTNTGIIVGDVYLNGSGDRYDGRTGKILGTVFGGDGNDTILGGDEDNVFFGDAGADTMAGGKGDDFYFADNAGDKIVEQAGGGDDKVVVVGGTTFVLTGEVETLDLAVGVSATGSATANTITGNSSANTINGGAGNDTVDGGAGIDKLLGGFGSDALSGGTENDTLDGGADNDVVRGDAGIDKLLGGLGNDSLFGGTENDSLDGGAGNDAVRGEDGIDKLLGGLGNDTLLGGVGNDTLSGGAGIDIHTGGANADFFLFDAALNKTTNVDRITDFSHVDDTIRLENSIFKAIGPVGVLKAAAFFQGAAAHDATDRIIYNKATGALFYDDDGTGAHAQVQFAILTTKPANVAFNDFAVV
jgi:serralysin